MKFEDVTPSTAWSFGPRATFDQLIKKKMQAGDQHEQQMKLNSGVEANEDRKGAHYASTRKYAATSSTAAAPNKSLSFEELMQNKIFNNDGIVPLQTESIDKANSRDDPQIVLTRFVDCCLQSHMSSDSNHESRLQAKIGMYDYSGKDGTDHSDDPRMNLEPQYDDLDKVNTLELPRPTVTTLILPLADEHFDVEAPSENDATPNLDNEDETW